MSVSVIIPTYNRASTLPRALDSVFAQTLPPLEVIVIDDGSDDETKTVVERDYPDVIYLPQPNSGVSHARNSGIRHAKGEWLALLDSDDSWLPEKLQLQMASLNRSPQLRISHTDEIWIRNGVRVNQMNKHAKQGGYIFKHCLPLCVISPSAALIHHSVFQEYGLFDTHLPACEDYDLWLRICAKEAVDFIEKPLVVKYGGHQDQLSRKHWGMDRFRVYALQKLLDNHDLNHANRCAAIEVLCKKCLILSKGAEKRGHQERADHFMTIHARYQQELPACNTGDI
ncbi:MAG: glycosyl transferase [gamma proteobacterium symbiont of Stewartia floridana]|nr:glycosyltransferase [Candidatus Thiodiazotropha taylori]RLW54805.1 MAG: glycosyl transferase [gamma proteobacterium symbiont of Stewartia floridana]MCG8072586.1 glycosyltransferase [Candidatus Thiodiazotropha taylori]MCG8084909.1 glycosyltransferase [Candidatus Thiodiazotropha taylori]MCW4326605.1 glycosyltransferase [Candidatus Thiodiazotropha taylori]